MSANAASSLAQNMGSEAYSEQMGYRSVPQDEISQELMSSMKDMFKSQLKTHAQTDERAASYLSKLQDADYEKIVRNLSTQIKSEASAAGKDAPQSGEDFGSSIADKMSEIMQEMELSTMNHLIFGVTTRFGSSVNQLMRGQ